MAYVGTGHSAWVFDKEGVWNNLNGCELPLVSVWREVGDLIFFFEAEEERRLGKTGGILLHPARGMVTQRSQNRAH